MNSLEMLEKCFNRQYNSLSSEDKVYLEMADNPFRATFVRHLPKDFPVDNFDFLHIPVWEVKRFSEDTRQMFELRLISIKLEAWYD